MKIEPMRYLDLTLPDLPANLALDEALLLQAEAGESGDVLRVWETASLAVVLGSGCRVAEEADEPACLADQVPILRRSSGGGTVLLGPGCLLYSLVLSYDRDAALKEIRQSYAVILDRIGRSLAGLLPDICCAGISDLATAGLKFSGNAQQRKARYLLHHGTLLYGFDLAKVGRYLLPPPRQPEYRAGRAHAEFLRNLPATAQDLKHRLADAWNAQADSTDWPADSVRRLVADKYGATEWTRRR